LGVAAAPGADECVVVVQGRVPANASHRITAGRAGPFGENLIDREFTQWRGFFAGSRPPQETGPRWPPPLFQGGSGAAAAGSGARLTAPGTSSSKLGQPQSLANFVSDR